MNDVKEKYGGIDEIIIDNVNGFLFNFQNYDLIKFEQNFDCLEKINQINNIENISNILKKAYDIDINIWNEMSKNCISLCDKKYLKEYCFEKNLNLMEFFTLHHSNLLIKSLLMMIIIDQMFYQQLYY